MIESGSLAPMVDRVCSLADLPDAMHDLEAGTWKVIVAVDIAGRGVPIQEIPAMRIQAPSNHSS
ncbi:MAG: hypothetical protein IVW51_00300 [Thermaceae bacterium]|nr:hypothetical protein [Thermaceae bacterium]